jgi:murein DD-endopeptidase MepM/ murein hydrolase activator NlpD
MGTTGNSSGPHLHFAWKQLLGNGNTILARFEVRDPTSSDPAAPNAPLATCYEPRNYPASDSPHRFLYSTNEP